MKCPWKVTQREDFSWTSCVHEMSPKVSTKSHPFCPREVTYYVHEMSATQSQIHIASLIVWEEMYIWLAVQPCALKVRSYSNIGLQKNTLEITFYIFVLISLSLFPGLVYICHGFTEHMANYNGLGEASLIFFHCIYSTCTIRSRGLYIFTPFFTAVYNQERLIYITDCLCTRKR